MVALTQETLKEIQDALANRPGLYRMLASLFFKEVTDEYIEKIAAFPFPKEADDTLLAQGFKDLHHCLVRRSPDFRTDLAVEYARVFLAAGTYEGESAVPFESVYTSEEGLIMQEARDEVRHIYLENGTNVNEDLHLPEDHISFELEFIAKLGDSSLSAFEAKDYSELHRLLALQIDFIGHHLLNWLPLLREKISNCSSLQFYIAVGEIAQGYVEEDREAINEIDSMFADVHITG